MFAFLQNKTAPSCVLQSMVLCKKYLCSAVYLGSDEKFYSAERALADLEKALRLIGHEIKRDDLDVILICLDWQRFDQKRFIDINCVTYLKVVLQKWGPDMLNRVVIVVTKCDKFRPPRKFCTLKQCLYSCVLLHFRALFYVFASRFCIRLVKKRTTS